MCTEFVVDSSSRFPFRARTNRQTDATERPTHTGGYTAGVGNDNITCLSATQLMHEPVHDVHNTVQHNTVQQLLRKTLYFISPEL